MLNHLPNQAPRVFVGRQLSCSQNKLEVVDSPLILPPPPSPFATQYPVSGRIGLKNTWFYTMQLFFLNKVPSAEAQTPKQISTYL